MRWVNRGVGGRSAARKARRLGAAFVEQMHDGAVGQAGGVGEPDLAGLVAGVATAAAGGHVGMELAQGVGVELGDHEAPVSALSYLRRAREKIRSLEALCQNVISFPKLAGAVFSSLASCSIYPSRDIR